MKTRKKKWTTKNTHIERKKKKCLEEKNDIYLKIFGIISLVTAILVILLIALNNHIVGYDHFIGIPREWIHCLFK